MLRQYGQPASPLTCRPLIKVPACQLHSPGIYHKLATQRREQGTFAGAVGAQHRDDLPCVQIECQVAQYLSPTATATQLFDTEHQKPPWRRTRISSDKKNGAPSSAVMIPRGSSAGARSNRAVTSDSSSNAAPSSIEAGSSQR